MYSSLPSFILGFHGCDKELAEAIFAGKKHLQKSTNEYDWLGNGIYFWENNPQRALEYAKELKDHPQRCSETIKTPAIVGAIIDLGYCLNLLDSKSLQMVKEANSLYMDSCRETGYAIAENKPAKKSNDLLLRYRDCAVLEFLHATREQKRWIPAFFKCSRHVYRRHPSLRKCWFPRKEPHPIMYPQSQLYQGILPSDRPHLRLSTPLNS